jgi:hypothetical protein
MDNSTLTSLAPDRIDISSDKEHVSLTTTHVHGGESNAYTAIDSSLEIRNYLCF